MPGVKLLRLGVLVIIAGCTTQPNKVANGGPDLVCHSEDTIGSLITRSVCNTRIQREEQKAQLEDVRRAVNSGAGANPKPATPAGQ